MSPTDIITITDGPNRLTATRNPETSADQFNLWTSSAALDGGLGVDSTKTSRLGAGTVQSGARRPGRELTIGAHAASTTGRASSGSCPCTRRTRTSTGPSGPSR